MLGNKRNITADVALIGYSECCMWLWALSFTWLTFVSVGKERVNATSLCLCLHYELVFHHKWADAQFFMADAQFFGADAKFFRTDAQFFAAGLL